MKDIRSGVIIGALCGGLAIAAIHALTAGDYRVADELKQLRIAIESYHLVSRMEP